METISLFSNLQHLQLGDCSKVPDDFFHSIASLTMLSYIRLEKCSVGSSMAEFRWLGSLEKLELIDAQLREGFGDGLVKMQNLKKLLLIPSYTDEVTLILLLNAAISC